jgi:hypothetical protein
MGEQGHDIHAFDDARRRFADCLEVAILARDFPPSSQRRGRAALERGR